LDTTTFIGNRRVLAGQTLMLGPKDASFICLIKDGEDDREFIVNFIHSEAALSAPRAELMRRLGWNRESVDRAPSEAQVG